MNKLVLLLSLCYPVTALSTPFNPTNVEKAFLVTATSPLLHNRKAPLTASKLHLRIPRGGQQEDEDVIDLDKGPPADLTPPEEEAPVVEHKKEETTAAPTPILATKKSCGLMALLSPLITTFQSAGSSYSNALGANPIRTKSLTAGLTFFLSDYTAQRIDSDSDDDKPYKHDWTRTLVSAAVGLFYFGPAAHAWYEWIFGILPGTSLVSTLQKAALGQLLFGPSFTCIFFASSLLQSGQFTLGNWARKIKTDLPGAFLSGVGFWPIVDLISFSLVPVKFIPLFINFCSFVWTIYLSMIANRPATKAS